MNSKKRLLTFSLAIMLVLGAFPCLTSANHSWGNYHWGRTSNPFTLKLGDNLSAVWKPYLQTTSSDWSKSTVMNTTIVAGQAKGKNCRPSAGRIEVCNSAYGNNGWLGIAQIWASGSHITQASTRVNDTYFNTPTYNTTAWRNLVMCQEVGHDFGLDHQDENFDNAPLGTCMDYTSDPAPNQHPNAHDYEELEIIYAHLDSTTTISATPAEIAQANLDTRASWGKLLKSEGRTAVFMRDFGGGHKVFTFVIWAS
jgi:hypothetical protein